MVMARGVHSVDRWRQDACCKKLEGELNWEMGNWQINKTVICVEHKRLKCCHEMRFESPTCSEIHLRPWFYPRSHLQLTTPRYLLAGSLGRERSREGKGAVWRGTEGEGRRKGGEGLDVNWGKIVSWCWWGWMPLVTVQNQKLGTFLQGRLHEIYLINLLTYFTFGAGRLLHLPVAEAVSAVRSKVRSNAQPRCNRRSQ